MKNSDYLFNNEAIATVVLGYFLRKHKIASIPKILLVLPFILHAPTIRKLRGNSLKRSLDEFIMKNSECIINFNHRYKEFLPLSVNSVTLLSEMKVISIIEDQIYYNPNNYFNPENGLNIGKRVKYMFKAIEVLDELMKESDTKSFYLKLKVEL